MQHMTAVGEVDRHLAIMVRLWRWDRIGGRTTACRRDLIELDQLLDRRLQQTPGPPQTAMPSRSRSAVAAATG